LRGAHAVFYNLPFDRFPLKLATIEVDGFLATILIVDDEAPIRSAVRRFLQIKGHNVVEACDGVEALELLAVRSVDMAIVDLMMPRMNGIELIDRMKSKYPETGIVVISGYSDIKDLSTSQPNVATILKKPFELQNLAEAVDLGLGQGRSATTS
jgi:two-component system cell cycle response regulator CpdR